MSSCIVALVDGCRLLKVGGRAVLLIGAEFLQPLLDCVNELNNADDTDNRVIRDVSSDSTRPCTVQNSDVLTSNDSHIDASHISVVNSVVLAESDNGHTTAVEEYDVTHDDVSSDSTRPCIVQSSEVPTSDTNHSADSLIDAGHFSVVNSAVLAESDRDHTSNSHISAVNSVVSEPHSGRTNSNHTSVANSAVLAESDHGHISNSHISAVNSVVSESDHGHTSNSHISLVSAESGSGCTSTNPISAANSVVSEALSVHTTTADGYAITHSQYVGGGTIGDRVTNRSPFWTKFVEHYVKLGETHAYICGFTKNR